MPYLKPIKGHTSCKYVKRYLEKNGRALATDLVGLAEYDSELRDWAEQMDYTRDMLGTNVPHKSKNVRTYNHYVLSPDPKDNLTLEQLREFTMDFLDRAFEGRFEIAVVYHDDNENGVIHAHFIVNNPNLEDGGRLSSWLTRKRVKEISKICQDLAQEYGYHNFLDRSDDDAKQIAADELGLLNPDEIPSNEFHGISGHARSRSFITNQENFYTKTERELLLSGGYSWKEDIRSRVRIAREISTTEKGFLQALELLDVKCDVTPRGDYQYSLLDTPKDKVCGYRLGRAYSRNGIRSRLADEETRSIQKPDSMETAKLLAAFDRFRIVGINTIGYMKSGVTLSDVASSLETINKYNIRKTSGFDRAEASAPNEDAARNIRQAKLVMNAIGRDGDPISIHKAAKIIHSDTPIESLSSEEAAKLINKLHNRQLDTTAARASTNTSGTTKKRNANKSGSPTKQAINRPNEQKQRRDSEREK